MPFYEKGKVRVYYEEAGSGYPLIIPGGGLNATIKFFTGSGPFDTPFNAMEEFPCDYRCITFDMRTAVTGQSTGPLDVDGPWGAFTDDQLGLMDHLIKTPFPGTPNPQMLCLRDAFDPKLLYEPSYEVKHPKVLSVGLAAMRDVVTSSSTSRKTAKATPTQWHAGSKRRSHKASCKAGRPPR